MPDEPSDAELVEAARRDPAAFDALYRRHLPGVFRYVLARIGSVATAEDIAASVFVDALDGLRGYREQGCFPAWLYTIARRHVAAFRRRPSLPTGGDVDEVAVAAESDDVERLVLLGRAMNELGAEQREAIMLRFFGGMRVLDVAATMGKGESAVKMLIHRGLAQLRQLLSEADGE